MYHKSSSGLVHKTYFSQPLSKKHDRLIFLTICRNMPTDSDLWTPLDYHELSETHTPCKLCLLRLENHIAFSIREYCRLVGYNINSAFAISENILPNIITQIQGEK